MALAEVESACCHTSGTAACEAASRSGNEVFVKTPHLVPILLVPGGKEDAAMLTMRTRPIFECRQMSLFDLAPDLPFREARELGIAVLGHDRGCDQNDLLLLVHCFALCYTEFHL